MPKKRKQPEEILKTQISQYLVLQYPDIIFRFDIAADLKLPIGLVRKSKKVHKHQRGYPDLFIAEPKGNYAGLYLELKKDKWEVFKKRDGGMLKKDHLDEQKAMLDRLNKKGYYADWGLGFDDTKEKIDKYLSL